MIDAILRGLIVGGSAYAGARMGEKYLTGATETPVWTGHVGGDVGRPSQSGLPTNQALASNVDTT
jgi:hypothetical protein